MSGTTPTGGSDDQPKNDPYASPGDARPPSDPPPSYTPPPANSESANWGEPAAAGYQQAAPEPPAPILNGVRLMYVGAGIALVQAISTLLSRDALRDAVEDANTGSAQLTADQIDTAVNVALGVGVVVQLIGVALWLWMAATNKRGKSWARTVATVLGGLNIVLTLYSLTSGGTALTLAINVVSIVLAAVILYFLYRPESSAYYRARSQKV